MPGLLQKRRFHLLMILWSLQACARPVWSFSANQSFWPAGFVHPDRPILASHLHPVQITDSVDLESWRIWGGLLSGALATALSSAGGIGGGGLYVPIFNLVLGFDSKTSAALSSCMIVGGSLVNIVWYAFQKDRTGFGPLVDYDVTLLCLPNVLLGISAGVLCNVASPSWLVTVLLVVVLSFMTFRSCRNASQRWNMESSCLAQSESLTKLDHADTSAFSAKGAGGLPLRCPPLSNIPIARQEYKTSCRDQDLENPLLQTHSNGQRQFPLGKIGMLSFVWISFLVVQLVRGSSDGQNFFGIQTCGTVYWIVTVAQLPIAMAATASTLLHLHRNSKITNVVAPEEAVSITESGSIKILPVYALVAGFLGGMLGLGGGMIISPLFCEMGMHPQTTAATCSYMVFFSSSLSVIQFWLLGRIPQLYALSFASLAFVFSAVGLLVIHTVISKYGRVSLIVFSVSTVMAISAVLMAFFGTWDVIVQMRQNDYMGFRSPC